MKTVEKAKLDGFLGQLAQKYSVLVPVDYNGLTQFAPYSQVQEGVSKLYLDGNVTVSPKTVYLPQSEAMYKFRAQGKKLAIEEMPALEHMQVLFGVRHCDTKAIACLDKVFLDEQFPDPQYKDKRDKTIVFALACNNPKATCFCESMGIDRAHADNSVADVQVYDLGDVYGFEAVSEKGKACLDGLTGLNEGASRLPEQKPQSIAFDAANLPEKLKDMFDHPIWDEYAFKCLNCGTCSYICPTCHCFDINNKMRGTTGLKLRTWDSCMFGEYTQMAGGHNPRPGKKERVRNRFLHKLQYFNEKHDMSLCVGCGRCIAKCPVNMDITKFIRQVIAE